ncbi:probable E3 ubiquitin-protein ligase RHY1A [Malania oleifera]|uniref:probable E3 ubiquitin-protein ligase RHY1A n=1 Tax=Malania oleifera TaxID=397392 RepID=UPI0025ADF124|nr:probable E3 ubiquitin-protein ligase RHY1A [Malania oleifera]
MAGNLPGVECARRRRSGGWSDSPAAVATRRSSFCLYASKHETSHLTSSSTSSPRSALYQAYQDEKLGGVAREAKERLDERLRTGRKSETSSSSRRQICRPEKSREAGGDGSGRVMGELQQLQTGVYGQKKSGGGSGGSKRFSWAKLGWKAAEQEECAVCLERFRPGDTLVHPPCAHRFHCKCLAPWLETNSHCPCCRMEILLQTIK